MNTSIAHRLFMAIAIRAAGETDVDVDALEVGTALGIVRGVDLFPLVDDLIARDLLMDTPQITWGALNVRLTSQGRDTFAREQTP